MKEPIKKQELLTESVICDGKCQNCYHGEKHTRLSACFKPCLTGSGGCQPIIRDIRKQKLKKLWK